MGGGPAGMSAAYYLARLGYPVTVLEAMPVPGGMMAIGIPAYRLPRETWQAEIAKIVALGVELRLDAVMVGTSPSTTSSGDSGRACWRPGRRRAARWTSAATDSAA